MRFLTSEECGDWLARRRLDPAPATLADPVSGRRPGYEFRIPDDAGRRVALCRHLWGKSGDEQRHGSLLVITNWSLWPSGEHFPLFIRLRNSFGERRGLIDAPGHVFEPGEGDDGLSFLCLATLFLWNYSLYSESGTAVTGCGEQFGAVFESTANPNPSLRAGLENLKVLV